MTHETMTRNAKMWEEIYSQTNGIMSYPDEVLVRIGHRLLDPCKHRTILDYGFGSGSNMIHLIKKGHKMCGAEVSNSATVMLKDRLRELGLEAELRGITNGKIPFEDCKFDAVIAWLVLYYNDWETFNEAMAEINRVLRPGGLFLGTMAAVGDYSHSHSVAVGNGVFRSTVPGQEGATLLIVDEADLEKCFPHKNITTGAFGFNFRERHAKHWIVSYEK